MEPSPDEDVVPDAEEAIRMDPRLSPEQKEALVRVYRNFVPLPYLQIVCYRLWERMESTGSFPAGYKEDDAARLLTEFCHEQLGRGNLNFLAYRYTIAHQPVGDGCNAVINRVVVYRH